jgi:hypothetical protein
MEVLATSLPTIPQFLDVIKFKDNTYQSTVFGNRHIRGILVVRFNENISRSVSDRLH